MGDVFRSGNQNVIAEINEKKLAQKNFNYLQAVNITKEEMEIKVKKNLVKRVLTNYISEKIILLKLKKKEFN